MLTFNLERKIYNAFASAILFTVKAFTHGCWWCSMTERERETWSWRIFIVLCCGLQSVYKSAHTASTTAVRGGDKWGDILYPGGEHSLKCEAINFRPALRKQQLWKAEVENSEQCQGENEPMSWRGTGDDSGDRQETMWWQVGEKQKV